MRFIIYGAGGVGGVIGAQLHLGGEDVVLIARGAHLEALRERGMHYETPFESRHLDVPAVDGPAAIEAREDDIWILTCKSQHTVGALDDLRTAHGDGVRVVCGQNGVANERAALRRFANVYAMLIFLPAQLIEPGRVQCHAKLKSGVLDLGCFPGGTDAVATEVAERLEKVNFSVRPDPRVMRFKYAKLLTNLMNALDAVAPKGDAATAILAAAKAEGRACLDAAAIDYADDDEVKARRAGVFEFGDIPGVERVGGSSRQSLLRGTGDIEADYLNGEIVRLGREHGVATPVNTVLQRLAVDAARRRLAPDSVSLAEVAALIDAERG